jgi:hypothetical protein
MTADHDAIPAGHLPTLRGIAEELLMLTRAGVRFGEDYLTPLFAAIDPQLTDEARAILTRRFHTGGTP